MVLYMIVDLTCGLTYDIMSSECHYVCYWSYDIFNLISQLYKTLFNVKKTKSKYIICYQ